MTKPRNLKILLSTADNLLLEECTDIDGRSRSEVVRRAIRMYRRSLNVQKRVIRNLETGRRPV